MFKIKTNVFYIGSHKVFKTSKLLDSKCSTRNLIRKLIENTVFSINRFFRPSFVYNGEEEVEFFYPLTTPTPP